MTILNAPLTTTQGNKNNLYTNVGSSSQELWDVCHDAAGTGSGTSIKAGWTESAYYSLYLWRGYLQFLTSGIGSHGTISLVKLKISGTQYTRNESDDYIIGSASSTDYSDLKTTTDYGTLTKQGTGSGVNARSFTDTEITLNSSAIAGINKTGNTLISLRGIGDTTDVNPNDSDSYDYLIITSATLIVEYSVTVVAPTVTTQAVSAIAETTATLNGTVTDDGGEDSTVRGFYLKAGTGTPTSSDTVISETGSFSASAFALGATGLTAGTLYSVVPFATNSLGTSTGTTVTFTPVIVPVVRNPNPAFFLMFT